MRLLSTLLLLPLLLQAQTKNIGTRDGVVTAPNRTITFPMQVRFTDLVATNLATRGYAFPQELGIPGQTMTVSPDGLSLIFRSVGAGDMLRSIYDVGIDGVVDNSEALGGVLATNYATRAWVVDQIAAIEPVDLSDYVTDQDLADAIAGIDLSDFALEGHTHDADDIVSGKLDMAQIPDAVATTNYVVEAIAAIPPLDLSGYATTNMVAEAIAAVHDAVTLGPGSLGSLTNQQFTLMAADIAEVTDLLYSPLGHDHSFAEITGSVATNQLPSAVVLSAELDEALAEIPLHDAVTAGSHITVAGQVVSVDTNSLDTAGGMATDVELADAIAGVGGGVAGSTGGTDNLVLRADGAGGATLQNSSFRIDDIATGTQRNLTLANTDGSNAATVIQTAGTGAFILGPKPDGGASGGNARGASAIDLQCSRSANTQVASGGGSIAIGGLNTVSGYRSIAVGYNNVVPSYTTNSNAAFGYNNSFNGSGYVNAAFGTSNAVGGTVVSTALGHNHTVNGFYSTAIGCRGTTSHSGAVVVGANSDSAVSSDRVNQFKVRADGGMTHQTNGGTRTDYGKRASAPGSPVAGDRYYDTSTNKERVYNGSTWNDCW